MGEGFMGDEWEGLTEMVRFFGWRRAAEILGSCVVLALMQGQATAVDAVKEALPSDPTKYRLRQDARRFRVYLEARGKAHLLGEPGAELESIGEMAKRAPSLEELRRAG